MNLPAQAFNTWTDGGESMSGTTPSPGIQDRARVLARLENRSVGQVTANPPARAFGTEAVPVSGVQRDPATLIAEWNGCVATVGPEFFAAELVGVLGAGVKGEEEDAEIPISDVAETDKELLAPGNFFRLCVFYELRNDRPLRYTQVVFRRLPAYRAADLRRVEEEAAELHRGLRVE